MAQLTVKTETAMANQALSLLRVSDIASLEDDTSRNARVMRKWYAAVRDRLLRGYEWNFAKGYLTLPAAAGAGNFRWSHSFGLPEDVLRVLDVETLDSDEWQVVGRNLVANADGPLNVTVTLRIVEVPQWDDLFCGVFVVALAEAGAPEMAQDERIYDDLKKARAEAWQLATSVDAAEGVPERASEMDFEFIRERRR